MAAERCAEVLGALRAVLDRRPEERTAALAAVCQGDAELRSDVESLLAHELPAAAFLEPPACTDEGADTGLSTGSRVGPYRLERLLGIGGMGAVWLAERADEQYQKQVAIKLVKAGMDTADVLDRFRAERQMLARLEHPHIARLLDGGTTDRGRPYLVMEYVEGTRIDAYCESNRLPIAGRLDLFAKVCGAVEYAHRNLVVHRDLKPSNILVTADGEPRLLDFGIAKALDPGANDPGGSGAMAPGLTPRYASPEQVRGEPITTASDVYSLGVILYELLTGRGPARERPGRRLGGDLDAILLKALRKEPESRYSSPEQLRQDLERHERGQPVLARPSTWRYRAGKFVRRHAVEVIVATALLVSLVGGIVAVARQARIAAGERNVAITATESARESAVAAGHAARRADRVVRFLQRVLATGNPRQSRLGTSVAEALDQAAATVQQEFGQDPEVAAAVHNTIGQTWLDLGRYVEAERELRQAVAIQERTCPGDSAMLAESFRSLGKLLYARADLVGARQATERALAIDRHLHDGDHEDTATDLNNLAAIARSQVDYDSATRCIAEALAMRRALFGEQHVAVAESLNNQSMLHRAEGQLDAAEALTRRVLELRRQLLGEDHPDTIQSLDNLAVLLAERQDYGPAEEHMREVVARSRQSLGEAHPEFAVSLMNLGQVLSLRGNHAEAEALFREALQVRRQALPEADERTVRAARQLAQCLVAQQRFAPAEQVLAEALEQTQRAAGDHRTCATLVAALIELQEAWGRPEQAAAWRLRLRSVAPAGDPGEKRKN